MYPEARHQKTLPEYFYRVQHRHSFTIFDGTSFNSNGHYMMAHCYWLNPEKVYSHLDWGDRPLEPSPFISVFDNEDAMKRVGFHKSRNYQNVIMARISSRALVRAYLRIGFGNETVYLPIWRGREGTIFISTPDLRRYLGIKHKISQKSEWLVLDHIPGERIVEIQKFS